MVHLRAFSEPAQARIQGRTKKEDLYLEVGDTFAACIFDVGRELSQGPTLHPEKRTDRWRVASVDNQLAKPAQPSLVAELHQAIGPRHLFTQREARTRHTTSACGTRRR